MADKSSSQFSRLSLSDQDVNSEDPDTPGTGLILDEYTVTVSVHKDNQGRMCSSAIPPDGLGSCRGAPLPAQTPPTSVQGLGSECCKFPFNLM